MSMHKGTPRTAQSPGQRAASALPKSQKSQAKAQWLTGQELRGASWGPLFSPNTEAPEPP